MKSIIASFFIILGIVSALKVHSQSAMPSPGEPKDFSLPKIKTVELENGMKITLVPFGNIPKAVVTLVIRSGNLNEAKDEVWLADFTGNLMKEGTRTRSGIEIADQAASMGGTITVTTGSETTTISGDVLSEFAPRMAELIADVAMNPVFPESEVDRLKNDLARDLSIQKSQPSNLAFELFAKVLYGDHPFGRIFPDEGTIKSFTAERARLFHEKNFGALRSHLYVAGKFDESELEDMAKDLFAGWKRGEEPLILIPEVSSGNTIHLAERQGAPQSVLNIGMQVPDPSSEDYIPLLLTNSMLGGSFTSRITRNIREDKGYTYSPYSRLLSRYRSAVWMQFAEVETSVTVPSLKEIMYEVDRLSNEPVGSSELIGAKNYVTGIFVLANSTSSGIISQLAFTDLHGLGPEWLGTYIRRIRAVTAEDVQAIMKKYFDRSRLTIIVTGDSEKIGKGMDKFGKMAEL